MNILDGIPQDVTGHRNLGDLLSTYLSYIVNNEHNNEQLSQEERKAV